MTKEIFTKDLLFTESVLELGSLPFLRPMNDWNLSMENGQMMSD